MKTKILALIGALLLTAAMLAGCGKKEEPLPDTVKWFNTAYAALTAANEGNLNAIGGVSKNAVGKLLIINSLKEYWDVTDRESAEDTLDWLLTEGHRTQYLDDLLPLKEAGFLDMNEQERDAFLDETGAYSDEEKQMLLSLLEPYDKFGEQAIAAWDYCRALQLLGYYYVADLYTKEEALDQSLEIAKTLQQSYSSWEEMMESYLWGYQYWQEDDPNDSNSPTAARRAVYETLKSGDQNPYTLDWNLELEKSW